MVKKYVQVLLTCLSTATLLEKLIINHFIDKSLSQRSYGIFIDLKNTLGQGNSSNVEHLSSMERPKIQ